MTIKSRDDLVVQLQDVSVRYQLATEPINTLKERIIRRLQGKRADYHEILALRDINLNIRQGEAVGIIGRNGAGKSTLLKTIARVIQPTTGRVRVQGTMAPLIGLGAGFHPELTGYENIFLNGAILGFSPEEMRARLQEIVEFSELQAFIHSPLRTYSSGMSLRLGFAIAASINPDLLIIDEVLAVGDEAFKAKCIKKMDEFRQSGKTILFVSHALQAVRDLCDRAMWLEDGQVRESGETDDVIQAYVAHVNEQVDSGMQPIRSSALAH